MDQIQALKLHACKKRMVVVMISQIDHSYDSLTKAFLDLDDVRLPNPLDLKLFKIGMLLLQWRQAV